MFSSECHSFWRNHFSQPLFQGFFGVILFGAMRRVNNWKCGLEPDADSIIVAAVLIATVGVIVVKKWKATAVE